MEKKELRCLVWRKFPSFARIPLLFTLKRAILCPPEVRVLLIQRNVGTQIENGEKEVGNGEKQE